MAERDKARKQTTVVEGYISLRARPPDAPLLLFEHIHKTGGTSLKHVIRANLIESADRIVREDLPKRGDDAIDRWWRDFLAGVPDHERRLHAVASHWANYLFKMTDRPVQGICMVREPVDRVLSRYFFWERPLADRASIADIYIAGFETLPRSLQTEIGQFHNWQSRLLLVPHHDPAELPMSLTPPPDAELWKQRIRDIVDAHYLVGIHERFEDSVRYFAHRLKWKRLLIPHKKVNARRTREEEIDDATRDLVLQANWLDVELYRHATDRFNTVLRDLALASSDRGSRGRLPRSPTRVSRLRTRLDRRGRVIAGLRDRVAELNTELVLARRRIDELERLVLATRDHAGRDLSQTTPK
jgi:hypothetical protein